jgi:hypothetical protein
LAILSEVIKGLRGPLRRCAPEAPLADDGVLKKASINISDDSGGKEVAAEEDLFVLKERKKKKESYKGAA